MEKVLLSWVGQTDLDCAQGERGDQRGALAAIAEQAGPFGRIVLLSNYSVAQGNRYLKWLQTRGHREVELHQVRLRSVVDFGEIFQAVNQVLDAVVPDPRQVDLAYNIASGTSAMATIWTLLGLSSRPACLWRSSLEVGVEEVVVPFDISAEYLPEIDAYADRRALGRIESPPARLPSFEGLVYRGRAMSERVSDAVQYAAYDLPVLILGETGTGKDVFARAIHGAGRRHDRPFVPVNCGAIPAELVESELFGHVRGAFTGAGAAKPGFFEQANGGVIFLDELGELSLAAQVKLLRVLQSGEVRRVGDSGHRSVDVRVIAATHRDLGAMVRAGEFREDLYYRLAVLVLDLPPLRARGKCLPALIDHALTQINGDLVRGPGQDARTLALAARARLLRHPWTGNYRELNNVLTRAALHAKGPSIRAADVEKVLATAVSREEDRILHRGLGDGFDINELLDQVRRHYLERAFADANGNASRAAKLLGLGSRNCLQWKRKYLSAGA